MLQQSDIESALAAYKENEFIINQFLKRVVNHFSDHPKLNEGPLPPVHSIKYRLKAPDRLEDKIKRKWEKDGPINGTNLFDKITDLAGIRILHLYQDQFPELHKEISHQVEIKEWFNAEPPRAYTWDPESRFFFEKLGIKPEIKDTFYTSIHYLIKPREDSHVKCEIQVRTLFEEIWGEIDHTINYPHKTQSVACMEQLRVLSKLASTGTRLADSIFRSHREYEGFKNPLGTK